MQIVITTAGTIHSIYDETIDLSALGQPAIARASHVEPDATGHWHADLAPVGGPQLGPFSLRTEALAAEQSWLETHWLTGRCQRQHDLM
jgi:hypothetical protein